MTGRLRAADNCVSQRQISCISESQAGRGFHNTRQRFDRPGGFDRFSDRLKLNAPTVRIILNAVLDATDAVIKYPALSAALRSGRHHIGA